MIDDWEEERGRGKDGHVDNVLKERCETRMPEEFYFWP
jgi:hypothetical protein